MMEQAILLVKLNRNIKSMASFFANKGQSHRFVDA